MPQWNNNDREDSKPTWLNAAQKRYCVRTNAGWEIPTPNAISNLGNQGEGTRRLSATGNGSNFVQPLMELIVAMPNDPAYSTGITGATSSAFANRASITGGNATGLVAGLVNRSPYISAPFSGDGATSGGPNSLGLNHSETGNYGVNAYGVSTLYWGTASVGITKIDQNTVGHQDVEMKTGGFTYANGPFAIGAQRYNQEGLKTSQAATHEDETTLISATFAATKELTIGVGLAEQERTLAGVKGTVDTKSKLFSIGYNLGPVALSYDFEQNENVQVSGTVAATSGRDVDTHKVRVRAAF